MQPYGSLNASLLGEQRIFRLYSVNEATLHALGDARRVIRGRRVRRGKRRSRACTDSIQERAAQVVRSLAACGPIATPKIRWWGHLGGGSIENLRGNLPWSQKKVTVRFCRQSALRMLAGADYSCGRDGERRFDRSQQWTLGLDERHQQQSGSHPYLDGKGSQSGPAATRTIVPDRVSIDDKHAMSSESVLVLETPRRAGSGADSERRKGRGRLRPFRNFLPPVGVVVIWAGWEASSCPLPQVWRVPSRVWWLQLPGCSASGTWAWRVPAHRIERYIDRQWPW